MAHILITSGPTRQYLDPVRYLTNASSGRMGTALANAALEQGHQVTIVSGPVEVDYPDDAKIIRVMTTLEMMDAAAQVFQKADGLIGAAAPCDYMPRKVEESKLSKTGQPLQLELIETPISSQHSEHPSVRSSGSLVLPSKPMMYAFTRSSKCPKSAAI